MFVQFVSLCYYEYLSEQVRKMKPVLGVKTAIQNTTSRLISISKMKLKNWLDNTPLYLQLQWFDVVESVEVSSALQTRRFTTEITARDRLYLDRLGIKTT